MSNKNELHLLTGAYALGALNQSETEEFEEYLRSSEEARAEVAALSDTAVLLGLASTPTTPSADLKARLMAQIAVTPQLAPEQSPAPLRAVTSPEDASAIRSIATASTGPASTGPAQAKASARWYSRPGTFLVAAAAIVALFIGGNVVMLNRANDTQAQASAIIQLATAKDAKRAEKTVSGGGTATLVWSAEQGRSAVVLSDLPDLPSGKTYELWYIAGSAATPAGTIDSVSDKTVKVLDGKMSGGDTVGITIEPSGGSKQPTSKAIVVIPSV